MRLSVLRYILAFLIVASFQNSLKGEEIKADVGEIKGFIGSKEVTASELEGISNSIREIIALDEGKEKADQSLYDLEEKAWLQLALLHEAHQQGIQVSEREVDEFIHNNPRFQVNHRFDPTRYEAVLAHLEIDPNQFRQTIEHWLLIDKLYDTIRREVTISEEELRKAFWEAYELRKASYVIFPLRRFMSPEAADALLEGHATAGLQEEISQAEEKSLAEAEKYRNLIQKSMEEEGLPFQEAARKLGLEVKETGYFSRSVPPAGLRQPDWMSLEAFLISEGELSRVVPVKDGYLFFTIAEIFPPTEKQYSRASKNFLLSYRRYKEEELIEEYKKKLLTTIKILKPRTPSP
jgi:hypothetical protein